jgi:hypothetical protein
MERRTSDTSSSPPLNLDERDCGFVTPISPVIEPVVTAGHMEPLATIAEENPRPLATNSKTTSQPTQNGVKFLQTTTESGRQTIVEDGATSGVSLKPRVTISADEDQPVERIIIASPPAANSAAGAAIPLNTVNSTIKIREATEQAERIPVKPISSVENN